MTGKLLAAFKTKIHELKLLPDKGGCFELRVDGELIYSKLKTGKFPDEKWPVEAVRAKLK